MQALAASDIREVWPNLARQIVDVRQWAELHGVHGLTALSVRLLHIRRWLVAEQTHQGSEVLGHLHAGTGVGWAAIRRNIPVTIEQSREEGAYDRQRRLRDDLRNAHARI